MLYRALVATAVVAVSAKAIDVPSNHRKLSFTAILGYAPGSQVDDHNRIDLDQSAIEKALGSTPPDYTAAKGVYQIGIYSKPSAVCTVSGTTTSIGSIVKKSDKIYYETTQTGVFAHGKASATGAAADTSITFSYPVAEGQIIYDYSAKLPDEPAAPGACWVGQGTGHTPVATKLCLKNSQISATAATESLIYLNCNSGTAAGGKASCGGGETELKVKCTNRGKRTLAGFSTAAKKKMYDASMSSSDCPKPDPTKKYTHGCPYTSFKPYFEYYCKSTTSSCNANGDYANQIILAGLDKTNGGSTFDNGKVDLSKADDDTRKEFIKKGTAYLSAWMYAIREFEDAIDDCVAGSNSNGGSSGPVHAWDEGVAFFVGSVMRTQFEMFSQPTGFLAYTLGNKRCANFKTCGVNGNLATKEQAQANTDLFLLFTEGQQRLITGDCAGTVPIKNKIVQKMTVPLIQGTLRYAWKMATTKTGASSKAAAEGAIFAAGVLPQVHACDPAAAKIIDDNTNIANFHGAKKYDFTAVKKAFEGCYAKMFPDYPDACGLIGGLWDGTKYYTAELNGQKFDASPCVSATASSSSSDGLSTGALVGIIVAAVIAVLLLLLLVCVVCKERAGKPVFAPVTSSGTKA